MICYVVFVFSILLSVTGRGVGATAAYDPTDIFLINCGEYSLTIDSGGRTWTPEGKIISSNSDNASFSSHALYRESENLQVPFMNARIFRSDFTYSFPISPGWKFIRLYFYPTRYYAYDFDSFNSFFSVNVNGFTLLKNFSAVLTVNASIPESKSLIKEFIVPVNKTLNLTFTPSKNSLAFVNGVEINSMPDRFFSKGGFDNMISNVGSTVDFSIDNSTAFETVYRLNVGGQMVADVGDSGMFRLWLSDDEFLLGVHTGVNPYVPNVVINYTEKTPAYVAPEYVYATCRTMGNVQDPQLNLNFNLTWLFTVDAGFNYLVRLHFCETLPDVNATGQRVFSIFIDNQIAKLDMDVFWLSGGSRIPIYLDFSVDVGSERGPRPDLRLDLYPYKGFNPMYYDAILNGVEILKLNNSDGNLAGPNPNPLLSSNFTPKHVTPNPQMKGKSHILVKTVIAVGSAIGLANFIFVVLMLSMRQMKRKKRKDKSVVMFKKLLNLYT